MSLTLVVAMLALYRQVVDIRAAVREQAQTLSEEQTVMHLLTQDLRSAFVYPLLGLGVDGSSAGQVRFVTVALAGGISWVVQKATATEQYPPQPATWRSSDTACGPSRTTPAPSPSSASSGRASPRPHSPWRKRASTSRPRCCRRR